MKSRTELIKEIKDSLKQFAFKGIIVEDDLSLSCLDQILTGEYARAFHNMAEVLGIPDECIGLNTITLVFKLNICDPKTKNPLNGSFDADFNLTISTYDPCFIHEWAHALDAYAYNVLNGMEQGKIYVKGCLKQKQLVASNNFCFSKSYRDACKKSSKENNRKNYLLENTELFARGFEKAIYPLLDSEAQNALISKSDLNESWYPSSDEACKILKFAKNMIKHTFPKKS